MRRYGDREIGGHGDKEIKKKDKDMEG